MKPGHMPDLAHAVDIFPTIAAAAGLKAPQNLPGINLLNAEVRANQAAEEAAGHWGTPCLVFDGEPFFGQDRIDMALWRMKQNGLKPRGA